MTNIVPLNLIERRIFFFRGEKVMIDRHLAENVWGRNAHSQPGGKTKYQKISR
jgi:hypothetical protein